MLARRWPPPRARGRVCRRSVRCPGVRRARPGRRDAALFRRTAPVPAAPLPSRSRAGTRELLNPRRSPTRASGAESSGGGAPCAGRPPARPSRQGPPRSSLQLLPTRLARRPRPPETRRPGGTRPVRPLPPAPRPARPHPPLRAAGPRSDDAPRRPAVPRRREGAPSVTSPRGALGRPGARPRPRPQPFLPQPPDGPSSPGLEAAGASLVGPGGGGLRGGRGQGVGEAGGRRVVPVHHRGRARGRGGGGSAGALRAGRRRRGPVGAGGSGPPLPHAGRAAPRPPPRRGPGRRVPAPLPCPASAPLPSRSAAGGGGGRAAEGSCGRRRGLRGGQAQTHVGLLFPKMHLPRQRALGLTGSGSVAGGQGGRGGGGRRQQRRRGEEKEEVCDLGTGGRGLTAKRGGGWRGAVAATGAGGAEGGDGRARAARRGKGRLLSGAASSEALALCWRGRGGAILFPLRGSGVSGGQRPPGRPPPTRWRPIAAAPRRPPRGGWLPHGERIVKQFVGRLSRPALPRRGGRCPRRDAAPGRLLPWCGAPAGHPPQKS